jgi:prepilin-type N-terminal cleavage/methylation domain-containing protein
MLTTHGTARAHRAGFTLVELMIAMILMGLVAGAIVKLLLRQQRFYAGANDVIETRQQIREAAAMLPADLKGISSVGGDIYAMTDSSIDFRSVFGSSIACAVDPGGGWASTVPLVLARQSAMTNWALLPAIGDSVAIYDEGATTSQADDGWDVLLINKVDVRTGNVNDGCPLADSLAQASDLTTSNPSYKFTFSVKAPNITVGAAMRFFRRVHYSLYHAADGNWYLGYYACRAGACGVISPIAGPLQAYATDGTSGLQFTYYDSTGAVTAIPQNVARIGLVVRGQGTSPVNLAGTQGGGRTFRDSLSMQIRLRNRK